MKPHLLLQFLCQNNPVVPQRALVSYLARKNDRHAGQRSRASSAVTGVSLGHYYSRPSCTRSGIGLLQPGSAQQQRCALHYSALRAQGRPGEFRADACSIAIGHVDVVECHTTQRCCSTGAVAECRPPSGTASVPFAPLQVVLMADGQVTMGGTVVKPNVRKTRKIGDHAIGAHFMMDARGEL